MITELPRCFAILAADRRSFTMRRGDWRLTVDIEKLDDWIKTYQGLRDRQGYKGPRTYAEFYQPMVETLSKLKQRLEGSPAA